MSYATRAQRTISESTLFSNITGPEPVGRMHEAYNLVFAQGMPVSERDEQSERLIDQIQSFIQEFRAGQQQIFVGSHLDSSHLRVYVPAGMSTYKVSGTLADIVVEKELEFIKA